MTQGVRSRVAPDIHAPSNSSGVHMAGLLTCPLPAGFAKGNGVLPRRRGAVGARNARSAQLVVSAKAGARLAGECSRARCLGPGFSLSYPPRDCEPASCYIVACRHSASLRRAGRWRWAIVNAALLFALAGRMSGRLAARPMFVLILFRVSHCALSFLTQASVPPLTRRGLSSSSGGSHE